jgi:hypothetical protein
MGPVTEYGVLPKVGFGVTLVGGLDVEQARIQLAGNYLTAQRTETDVDLDVATLSLSCCWLAPLGQKIRVGPCALAELGWLRADGSPAGLNEGGAPWGSARAAGYLGVAPLRRIRLGIQVDAGLPFGQPPLIVGSDRQTLTDSVVAGARIVVELHFP